MAVSIVSLVGEDWRVWMIASSLFFRVVWSSADMLSVAGRAGRDGSIWTADEDGEDSASKRAWRTAESLVVRAGFAEWMVVAILDGPGSCSFRGDKVYDRKIQLWY